MVKKENVHLKLTEELSEIDSELEDAMEALSETNQRIDAYLNDDEPENEDDSMSPAELPDTSEAIPLENSDDADSDKDASTESLKEQSSE